jgi:hypothetical protein
MKKKSESKEKSVTFMKKHNIYSISIILIAFMLVFPMELAAQNLNFIQDFNFVRIDYNQKGMLILGFWAISNIIWGGISMRKAQGQSKGFHEMNLYWNLVNLLIAGIGYWQAQQEILDLNIWQTIENQQSITKILWLNFGLDVGYIVCGFFLIERGLRKAKIRLVGFGKSIVMQGFFLLIFDGILVGFHEVHGRDLSEILPLISLISNDFYNLLTLS